MPKMVLTSEFLSINANALHSLGVVKKAELVVEVEDKDVTNFASQGWKEYLGGLKEGTLNCEFFQDYAAANIDSIMWPLLGTVVPFELRPTQGAAAPANPKWTGSVLISKWAPIEGSVGDESTTSADFPTSGPVVRATA